MSILVFDSGIGGFSILRELRIALPGIPVTYVADDAGFPYGGWNEDELRARILSLFEKWIAAYKPQLCVIACNTATTLAIGDLRAAFPHIPFVGTVPAIKPAAEASSSNMISVLATPGTIKMDYTQNLVARFASHCQVTLVGASDLAFYAQRHICGFEVDIDEIAEQVRPCFVEQGAKRTDIVVLGCTHYPFVTNLMRKIAPWPVDWVNPAEAIAQQARVIFEELKDELDVDRSCDDKIFFTSNAPEPSLLRVAKTFGLT